MIDDKELFSIGVVERDTGIGRDTLRVWERRYGFPRPQRNAKGERAYTEKQLLQLQQIRRLMDQGLRPGKLVPLGEQGLNELELSLQPTTAMKQDETVTAVLDAIRSADADTIEVLLRERFEKEGMKQFILSTVAPLLKAVGDSWATGELEVFQEHFLSQQLIRVLNAEIAKIHSDPGKPTVLLATLSGEEHTLGLLMIAGFLSCYGVPTINLGGEVPIGQIGSAVEQFRANIVGITFSSAYPYNNIRPYLLELRARLPDNVEIWAGGDGVRRLRKLPDGIRKIMTLDKIPLTGD